MAGQCHAGGEDGELMMVNIIEEHCDGKDDGDDDFADDHYNISSKDDNITTTDIDITQGKNAILNYHHHCFHNFQHSIHLFPPVGQLCLWCQSGL